MEAVRPGWDKDTLRLMALIDAATDTYTAPQADGVLDVEADYLADSDFARLTDFRLRQAHVAALGAIAFLLLRRDDTMWEAWERY